MGVVFLLIPGDNIGNLISLHTTESRDGYGGGEGWPSPPKSSDWGDEIGVCHPNKFRLKVRNCILAASLSLFLQFRHPNFFDHIRP